jgi:hypothetical protein
VLIAGGVGVGPAFVPAQPASSTLITKIARIFR